MRENVRDVRVLGHSARQEQIGGCASGFEEELEHGVWIERLKGGSGSSTGHAGRGGVDEHHGMFGVENLPDGVEKGRTKVCAVVVGFDGDTVGGRRD